MGLISEIKKLKVQIEKLEKKSWTKDELRIEKGESEKVPSLVYWNGNHWEKITGRG
jgi:uncharacterized protein with PIN domain